MDLVAEFQHFLSLSKRDNLLLFLGQFQQRCNWPWNLFLFQMVTFLSGTAHWLPDELSGLKKMSSPSFLRQLVKCKSAPFQISREGYWEKKAETFKKICNLPFPVPFSVVARSRTTRIIGLIWEAILDLKVKKCTFKTLLLLRLIYSNEMLFKVMALK